MQRALLAGLVYVAVVFAAAFAIGVIRVLVLAPRLGEPVAVLLEVPAVLALSWWICGLLVRRFAVGPDTAGRLAMGGLAFVVLQATEAGLAVTAFGQSPSQYLAGFTTLAGVIGLSGQIGFALIPLVRRRR